ncbi:hypothetical protein COT94_01070 [Candidatus Falkowbacteria bacterium CG10_big_fil_rev_8_21_14_0_10_37_14]|uniref:Uncharacterized protein n=1 Tax=Candidatus Falkowbacteria bacterium CG10_big_fil_rev_8_21_14_0_10_37_14 TaxID=1974561 RepID=A0A2M6WU09_9BACT|nr:MAG: hypothetical protein COT94_01070 [Candidatus Falkowbacteria bacterium CG10_big_fil_rev_8_21_14_0_10_37_14]
MKNLFFCEVFLLISVIINYFFVVYFEFGVLASYLFFGILLRMLVPDNWSINEYFWVSVAIYGANIFTLGFLFENYWKIDVTGKVLFITRFLLLSSMYWLGWMIINWLDAPIIVDSMDNYNDPS